MWFGSNVGAIRYDGANFHTFTVKDGLAGNAVVSVGQDNQGNIWFGTWGSGASRYDGKTWRTFGLTDGLVSDAIWRILKDKQGNMWFGAYSSHGSYGISKFDGNSWQNFDPFNAGGPQKPYAVRFMLEDEAGNLWFATDIGIARYQPN